MHGGRVRADRAVPPLDLLPWREAGPPNHHDDKEDSDQWVVNKQLSLSGRSECTGAVFVLIVQCLLSTFCNAAFMGLVYAKIARPQVCSGSEAGSYLRPIDF